MYIDHTAELKEHERIIYTYCMYSTRGGGHELSHAACTCITAHINESDQSNGYYKLLQRVISHGPSESVCMCCVCLVLYYYYCTARAFCELRTHRMRFPFILLAMEV